MAYPPAPPPAPGPLPAKQGNGFAVTALVTGIIGAVFAFVPVVNVFIAVPLGIIAVIFGIIGIVKAPSRGKGKGPAATGLVLGILAVIGTFVINALIFNAAKDFVDEECNDPNSSVYGSQECADLEDL